MKLKVYTGNVYEEQFFGCPRSNVLMARKMLTKLIGREDEEDMRICTNCIEALTFFNYCPVDGKVQIEFYLNGRRANLEDIFEYHNKVFDLLDNLCDYEINNSNY